RPTWSASRPTSDRSTNHPQEVSPSPDSAPAGVELLVPNNPSHPQEVSPSPDSAPAGVELLVPNNPSHPQEVSPSPDSAPAGWELLGFRSGAAILRTGREG